MSDGSEFLLCSCKHCGQSLEFPPEGIGAEVPCPTCGSLVLLEAEKRKMVFQIPKPKDYVARADPALPKCRVCGKDVSPSADICPSCGERSPGVSLRCPECQSTRVTVSDARVLGLGKAAAATVLVGPVGLLAALLPTTHTSCRCLDCGKNF